MDTSKLNGLEYMQAVVAGKISKPAMAETIPMHCTHAEAGLVRFFARADDRHLNRANNVHGGFTATVMDSVTSCALRTALEPGAGFVTIELNVKLITPVPRDADLTAEGKLIHVPSVSAAPKAACMTTRIAVCARHRYVRGVAADIKRR